jgi:Tse3 toxin immunity protein Tsi3
MPKQIIILVCIACLAACSVEHGEQRYKNYQELRHPDGFIVRIPPSMTAEQTPQGYIVRDPTLRRYKKEASVQRIAGIATDEAPNLAKRKKMGGRSVSYQIDKVNEGGSGGAEYRIRVLWVGEGGAFLYGQRDQSEYGEPGFDLCWDLVKTTELVHRK